jgi:hypothetical protein
MTDANKPLDTYSYAKHIMYDSETKVETAGIIAALLAIADAISIFHDKLDVIICEDRMRQTETEIKQ